MPDDLRKLLELQWRDTATGTNNRLKSAGVTMIDGDRLPTLVGAVWSGRDDLGSPKRLAYAQAMGDMIRYSGFVGEGAAGDAIGYWFSPDFIQIETAPLLRFDTNGHFSIFPGHNIAEGVLVMASHGNNRTFSELRDYLNELDFNISALAIQDIQPRECALHPESIYQTLIRSYSTDLLTTSVPDVGDPVNLMTTHRGPKLGPETE